MHRVLRGTTLVAGITGLLAGSGLIAGVPAVAADIRAQLPYDCTTASGTRKVQVTVVAKTPVYGKVGKAVKVGKVTLTARLPSGFAGENAADELKGAVHLAVTVSQNGRSVDAGWPAFVVTSAKPTIGGGTQITASGVVPALSPRAPGQVVWRGGALVLTMTRGGSSPAVVRCASTRAGVLGHISVSAGASQVPGRAGPGTGPGRVRAGAGDDPYFPKCVELPPGVLPDGRPNPKGGLNPDPRLKMPGPQFGAVLSPPAAGIPSCSRVAGLAGIAKLGSATPVAGEGLIRRGYRSAASDPDNYIYQQAYNLGLTTPATSTSLGFGFMPTTATVLMEQVATVPGANNFANAIAESDASGTALAKFKLRALAKAFVVVRVVRASVNGVPIDLGENPGRRCRTPEAKIELTAPLGGGEHGGLDYREGGTYSGAITVPAFRPGCGAGEDLSPLLTATTAGGGNIAKLEFGSFCDLGSPDDPCDVPREPLTFTVRPGGETILLAKPFTINTSNPEAKISCRSATMKLKFPKGPWVGQNYVGRVTSAEFVGCARVPGNVRQTLTLAHLPLPVHLSNGGGQIQLSLGDFSLLSRGTDGCLIRLGGNDGADPDTGEPLPKAASIAGPYNGDSHAWALTEAPGLSVSTVGTSCPDDMPGFLEGQTPVKDQTLTASFTTKPRQTITQP